MVYYWTNKDGWMDGWMDVLIQQNQFNCKYSKRRMSQITWKKTRKISHHC